MFVVTTRREFLVVAGGAASLAAVPAWAQGRPVVVCVSYPLAYFAERLAGDAAEIMFPVPADADPSFWRPGIAEISTIQSADLIVLNGAGFAAWTTKASLPRSRIVDTSAGFADRFVSTETLTHSHGAEGAHSHTGTASYTWMDFALAARQAEALAAAMVKPMPDAEAQIAVELERLLTDLATLDETARTIGAQAEGLSIIASHPRYPYFGRAYGLDLSAVDWDARETPTEDQWQALEARVAETGAELFIWEVEPLPEARDRIRELGLVDVVFPPLANRPETGDFVGTMEGSLERLKKAVSDVRTTPE